MAVLTDIIAELLSGINGMTIVGGYNFDYSNADERRPASKTYPNVLLEYPKEESRDDSEGPINSYNVDMELMFVVTVDDGTTPVDTALDNVLEDFKRLLEEEHNDLNCAGIVVGTLVEAEREYTHTRQRPGMITIIFNFNYRVQRSDPSLTT